MMAGNEALTKSRVVEVINDEALCDVISLPSPPFFPQIPIAPSGEPCIWQNCCFSDTSTVGVFCFCQETSQCLEIGRMMDENIYLYKFV